MLFLILLCWYAVGVYASYKTLRFIGGPITNGDVVMMAIAGLIGPVGFLYWLTYARHGWLDRPSRWFK